MAGRDGGLSSVTDCRMLQAVIDFYECSSKRIKCVFGVKLMDLGTTSARAYEAELLCLCNDFTFYQGKMWWLAVSASAEHRGSCPMLRVGMLEVWLE